MCCVCVICAWQIFSKKNWAGQTSCYGPARPLPTFCCWTSIDSRGGFCNALQSSCLTARLSFCKLAGKVQQLIFFKFIQLSRSCLVSTITNFQIDAWFLTIAEFQLNAFFPRRSQFSPSCFVSKRIGPLHRYPIPSKAGFRIDEVFPNVAVCQMNVLFPNMAEFHIDSFFPTTRGYSLFSSVTRFQVYSLPQVSNRNGLSDICSVSQRLEVASRHLFAERSRLSIGCVAPKHSRLLLSFIRFMSCLFTNIASFHVDALCWS